MIMKQDNELDKNKQYEKAAEPNPCLQKYLQH